MTAMVGVELVEIPMARVLPPPEPTLREQLAAALEALDEFVLDGYALGLVSHPAVVQLEGTRNALEFFLRCLAPS